MYIFNFQSISINKLYGKSNDILYGKSNDINNKMKNLVLLLQFNKQIKLLNI